MLFLKNLTKTFGEKAGDYVYFDGIDQFYKYFVFSAGQILCYWEKLPNHACKNCVYEALRLFFPPESLQIQYLLKNVVSVVFFSNIFTKP